MPELILILVVVLIIFGPKNLPKLGGMLGRSVKKIRGRVEDDDVDAAPGKQTGITTLGPRLGPGPLTQFIANRLSRPGLFRMAKALVWRIGDSRRQPPFAHKRSNARKPVIQCVRETHAERQDEEERSWRH